MLFVGCDQYGSTPYGLNNAARPLTLIAKSAEGVLIRDGDGNLYAYDENYYFAQAIMDSDLEPGAVIVGNELR